MEVVGDPSEDDGDPEGRMAPRWAQRWSPRAEMFSALLLAAATLATAFGLFQATRWNGVMLTEFNESVASGAAVDASQSQASQVLSADSSAWAQWRVATAQGDVDTADALKFEVFSFTMEAAFDAWVEDHEPLRQAAVDAGVIEDNGRPFTFVDYVVLTPEAQRLVLGAGGHDESALAELDPDGLDAAFFTVFGVSNPSPLFHEAYEQNSVYLAEVESGGARTVAHFEAGKRANRNSDLYVLSNILFAMTLFCAGVATKFSDATLKLAMLGLATVFLLAGLVLVISLPYR
jgi:hypothetical protein